MTASTASAQVEIPPWDTPAATADDIPGLIALFRNSFRTPRVHNLIPLTEKGDAWLASEFAAAVAGPPPGTTAPVTTALRVVRDADGTPLGMAIYRIVAANAGADARGWSGRWASVEGDTDVTAENMQHFFGPQDRAREYLMGDRPYVFLDSLGTLDSHRKQGIGAALVRWGNDYADKHGIECYLQASPLGFGVYERQGYRQRDVSAVVGEEPWVAMVRPAAGAAE